MTLYMRLEDAGSLRFPSGKRVASPAEYLGWHLHQIAERGIARVWVAAAPVPARVNHGRWITDCVTCGKSMLAHPAWRVGCCVECGAVYRDVRFPENVDDITNLLLARPRRETQNWEPGETLAQLLDDNAQHGVT